MRYALTFITVAAHATFSGSAGAEVPRVVTDIPVVQSLVAQVMGDLGQPVLLLDRGADAHSFQLRPSQAAALTEAGMVIWIGPEMTPWLDRAVQGLAPGVAQLRLLDTEGTILRSFGDAGSTEHTARTNGAGHDHAAEGYAQEGHEHDHDGTDPHAWLDPGNARHWLGVIAAELARLDPGNAATYGANAQQAGAAIAALDATLDAALAPVRDIPFVVFHDAYGYFVGHYGLTIAGALATGDAVAPGAAHLADLQGAMDNVACIFPEAGHDPKQVDSLAADTGVRLGGALDPEGMGQEPGPQLYASVLTGLADTLTACLTQSGP